MTRTVSPLWIFTYNTSGASETIFMKRFSRSSRPTGPKMRVPRGSLSGLMMTAALLDGAHHHGLHHFTALDVAARDGVFDRRHDDIADPGVPPRRAAEYTDAQDLLGTGVVGYLQPRFLLNHSIS